MTSVPINNNNDGSAERLCRLLKGVRLRTVRVVRAISPSVSVAPSFHSKAPAGATRDGDLLLSVRVVLDPMLGHPVLFFRIHSTAPCVKTHHRERRVIYRPDRWNSGEIQYIAPLSVALLLRDSVAFVDVRSIETNYY